MPYSAFSAFQPSATDFVNSCASFSSLYASAEDKFMHCCVAKAPPQNDIKYSAAEVYNLDPNCGISSGDVGSISNLGGTVPVSMVSSHDIHISL